MKTSTGQSRTWLILAYFFNTDGKAASQTITDRIPLFMREGILPMVISSPLGNKDDRFPHVRIYSCMPSGLQYELRYLLKERERYGVHWRILKSAISILFLPFYLLERLLFHLDTHWSWGISAAIGGVFAIFRYQPEIIYTTAGPSTTHLAGFILHKLSGRPWIAEIHDPLVYDTDKGKLNQRYIFNSWLEKTICRSASAVIYFTRHALTSADRRHPIAGQKIVLRPGAEFSAVSGVTYAKKNTIHFAHFGSLASGRNLSTLIQAFHSLLQEDPSLHHCVHLDIYGSELDAVSKNSLAAFPLGASLKVHGRLQYDQKSGKSGRQQVLEAMKQCDVLILLHGKGLVCEEYIPSKVYEYLFAGRPIIGFTAGSSELGEILLECGHQVVDPEGIDEIKKVLKKYIETWKEKGLAGGETSSPYTVAKTVRTFFEIVEKVNSEARREP